MLGIGRITEKLGITTLDRYVVGNWFRIFFLTALGFPIVSILINLTDTLNRLLDRGLTMKEIAISYVYSIPENAFIVMPAAVLFATVFTVGAMGRHSELTAAKAGGLSFYRLMLPSSSPRWGRSFLAFTVGEMAPGATARQLEIQKAKQTRPTRSRFNFVYRGDAGWVYTIRSLDVEHPPAQAGDVRAAGLERVVPRPHHHGRQRELRRQAQAWRIRNGSSRVIAGPDRQAMFAFRTMKLRDLRQTPADLLAEPKAPDEMRYAELGRYIERSSGRGTMRTN